MTKILELKCRRLLITWIIKIRDKKLDSWISWLIIKLIIRVLVNNLKYGNLRIRIIELN